MEFFFGGIAAGFIFLLFIGKGSLAQGDLQARCDAGDQSACAQLDAIDQAMQTAPIGTVVPSNAKTCNACECGGFTPPAQGVRPFGGNSQGTGPGFQYGSAFRPAPTVPDSFNFVNTSFPLY